MSPYYFDLRLEVRGPAVSDVLNWGRGSSLRDHVWDLPVSPGPPGQTGTSNQGNSTSANFSSIFGPCRRLQFFDRWAVGDQGWGSVLRPLPLSVFLVRRGPSASCAPAGWGSTPSFTDARRPAPPVLSEEGTHRPSRPRGAFPLGTRPSLVVLLGGPPLGPLGSRDESSLLSTRQLTPCPSSRGARPTSGHSLRRPPSTSLPVTQKFDLRGGRRDSLQDLTKTSYPGKRSTFRFTLVSILSASCHTRGLSLVPPHVGPGPCDSPYPVSDRAPVTPRPLDWIIRGSSDRGHGDGGGWRGVDSRKDNPGGS